MNKIDVYQSDRKVGELEVLSHIRLPFDSSLQDILDMTLKSRNLLYRPKQGDLKLEVRDDKLIAVADNRMCPGDFSLIVGFTSELEAYQPNPDMEAVINEIAPEFGRVTGADPRQGYRLGELVIFATGRR